MQQGKTDSNSCLPVWSLIKYTWSGPAIMQQGKTDSNSCLPVWSLI